MALWERLSRRIAAELVEPFQLLNPEPVGGGCINRAVVLGDTGGQRYFVKLNDATRLPMFEAEAEGLRRLAASQAVRVPRPVCTGIAEKQAFLIMEYLELERANARAQEALGRQLAALHRVTHAECGWHRDNTIGSTPQLNGACGDWVAFYRERRLRYQLGLAVNGGATELQSPGEKLLEQMPAFFANYRPLASLLHGDLWSGNAAATPNGQPVIFDPAVYFGDRETDLAMTELFGGFAPSFYSAYRDTWPLDVGYAVRKTLYNLYHVLNHFHLFGGSYASQAARMMQQLLSEVR